MNDPHVISLIYAASASGSTSYQDPPPQFLTNHLGSFEIRDGLLTFRPADHFPSEPAARAAVEPYLRSWELDADLSWGIGTIRFAFRCADIVDRNPPPPGTSQVIAVGSAGVVAAVGHVSFHVTRMAYPDPPANFVATADVEILFARFSAHLEGKEPLTSMAYFCLTVVEALAGGRKAAAAKYAIDVRLLSKVGELSAAGDHTTARKVRRGKPLRPLTGAEQHWLSEAIKALIRRVGAEASGGALKRLTLSDLPPI